MSESQRITISAGSLLLIGLILIAAFYLFPLFINVPQQQGIIQTQTQTQQGFVPFNVGLAYQERNALSGGTESTTSPSYQVFHSNGRSLASLSTLYGEQGVALASGSTTSFPVYSTDANKLFVSVNTGTAHYVDAAKLLASNPFITGLKWIPVDTATVKRLVAEIDLDKIGKPNLNIDPSLTARILIPVLPDDLSLTLSSPADQDGLGTTAGKDVYITWEITGLDADQAVVLANLYFTSNQTASLIDLLDVKIATSTYVVDLATFSNKGSTVVFNAPVATSGTAGGVVQYWRYFPSDKIQASEYYQGILIPRGSSDVDSIRITLHVKTYFTAATDAATVVIGYRLISAGNTLQVASTDSVVLGG